MNRASLALSGWLALGSGVFTAGYVRLTSPASLQTGIADGLTLAALLLLVVGLVRLVCRLGLFDTARFGYYKLVEMIKNKRFVASASECPTLASYKQAHPYEKGCLPFLLVAALDFFAAFLCL